MSIANHKIMPADYVGKDVTSLPDKLTGTAQENKAAFDRLVKQVVAEKFNALIDALLATDAGQSGAAQIGAAEISGLTGQTVQSLLEALALAKADDNAVVKKDGNQSINGSLGVNEELRILGGDASILFDAGSKNARIAFNDGIMDVLAEGLCLDHSIVTAETQAIHDDSTKLATTAFVQNNANAIKTVLADKVDKVAGKGLSSEDYTTAEKNKLLEVSNAVNGIEALLASL